MLTVGRDCMAQCTHGELVLKREQVQANQTPDGRTEALPGGWKERNEMRTTGSGQEQKTRSGDLTSAQRISIVEWQACDTSAGFLEFERPREPASGRLSRV